MALRTLVLAIAIPVVCLAQSVTLELASGVASPGTAVTLPLTLDEAGIGPASLQWTLEYAQADFSLVSVTLGPAATESGKTVNCAQTTGATKCVLWSMDAAPLGSGVIANVSLTASASTFANSSGIQVVNCLAANEAGNALPVFGLGGGVTLMRLITASPNPIPVPAGVALGQTTVSWNAPDSSSVEVHVGSATGPLLAEGGSTGSGQTGDWVSDGTVFVLVDGTTHAMLGATSVALAPPTISASPNPIPVATGASLGQTMITWNAPESSSLEVHIGSATGPLFAGGGATGSEQTGLWATDGMVFVLIDAITHAVLATTTVTLAQP
ncbi:MAG: cohesin domain-containing protein [Bryobacteraceae bacterium]